MNNKSRVILISVFTILLSSCGVLSKTHYGNGIKLNLEWGLFSKQKVDSAYLKKYHKPKESRPNAAAPIEDQTYTLKLKEKHSIPSDSSFSPSFNEAPQKPNITSNYLNKIDITSNPIKEFASDSTQPNLEKKAKFEKNAVLAAAFFWGGIISVVGIPLTIVGFILALISLSNIKREKKKGNHLRGKGLALSVVIAFAAALFFLVLFIVLLIVDGGSLVWF